MGKKRITNSICVLISFFLLFSGIGLDYLSVSANSLFACAQDDSSASTIHAKSSSRQDVYIQDHSEAFQFIHRTALKQRNREFSGFTDYSFICSETASDLCKFYFQKSLSGSGSDNLSHKTIIAYLHGQDGSKG
ncbi:MAG: hypothetical protein ACI4S2_18470 [Lachnospiraceae bacterium]